jgi:hypothetical protein
MILISFLSRWEKQKVMLSRTRKVNIQDGEGSMVGSCGERIHFNPNP